MVKRTTTRCVLPLALSVEVDPDRLAAMWRMSPQERSAAAHRGEQPRRDVPVGRSPPWAGSREPLESMALVAALVTST